MQPVCTRLICRAQNRFTPSIALWQHFVAPARWTTHRQRLSSSLAESSPPVAHESSNGGKNGPPPDAAEPTEEVPLLIRRMTTVKGKWENSKHKAIINQQRRLRSIARNEQLRDRAMLLAEAQAAFDSGQDYTGRVIRPVTNVGTVKEDDLPWCLPEKERVLPSLKRLDVEMDKFYEYARPDENDTVARQFLIDQVRRVALARLPEHTLELFGSERTGLALATSDIDLRLTSAHQPQNPALAKLPPPPPSRAKGIRYLSKIHWKMKKHNDFKLAMIRHARYPLISMQDRHTELEVQIVLSNDTAESREMMQDYMIKYPYLKTLYTTVKTIFDIRGLSDVYHGGFGSYSLFMMIVASIVHMPHPDQNAAGGLLNFLKFWSRFDTTKHGVSIEPAIFFDKEVESVMSEKTKSLIKAGNAKSLPKYTLSLRDPADATNDLGRKGTAIKHIQSTLIALLQQLELALKLNNRCSLLNPFVGHIYMQNYEWRQQLRKRGEELVAQTHYNLALMAKKIRERKPAESEPRSDSTAASQANDSTRAATQGTPDDAGETPASQER